MTVLTAAVAFTSYAPFPPPDPRYVHIHAACANVAHLSGAGAYVDNVYRDLEGSMRVLATDGSSAEALTYALFDGVGAHRIFDFGAESAAAHEVV